MNYLYHQPESITKVGLRLYSYNRNLLELIKLLLLFVCTDRYSYCMSMEKRSDAFLVGIGIVTAGLSMITFYNYAEEERDAEDRIAEEATTFIESLDYYQTEVERKIEEVDSRRGEITQSIGHGCEVALTAPARSMNEIIEQPIVTPPCLLTPADFRAVEDYLTVLSDKKLDLQGLHNLLGPASENVSRAQGLIDEAQNDEGIFDEVIDRKGKDSYFERPTLKFTGERFDEVEKISDNSSNYRYLIIGGALLFAGGTLTAAGTRRQTLRACIGVKNFANDKYISFRVKKALRKPGKIGKEHNDEAIQEIAQLEELIRSDTEKD